MKRRTLLQSVAAVFALPLTRLRPSAQALGPAAGPAALTEAHVAAVRAIAEVVLPASLGTAGRDKAVAAFIGWVRNYKEGADRGHSYGASTVSAPAPASPAARYPPQFAALDQAAAAQGSATFAALPLEQRRIAIEAALNTPQPVTRLPTRPTGANLVVDVMGFFFNGADGYDLAYNAAIGRDSCRSLDGSERAPEQLTGRSQMEAGSSDPAI